VGNVVCTRKGDKLVGTKLLMVQPVGLDDKRRGNTLVVIDGVGGGTGELVLLVQGSSARQTSKTENTPVDCTVFAIVDTIEKGGKIVFKKSSDKFQD
jgi:microcompartment protein CcmK/EutM